MTVVEQMLINVTEHAFYLKHAKVSIEIGTTTSSAAKFTNAVQVNQQMREARISKINIDSLDLSKLLLIVELGTVLADPLDEFPLLSAFGTVCYEIRDMAS